MTQEEIDKAVKERLRIANERLSAKNGVDPNDAVYRRRVDDLIYAHEHGISWKDAAKHRKGKLNVDVVHPTVAEVEKKLHRPINTKRPEGNTSTRKAVRDVLSGKRYDSIGQLAKELGVYWTTVRTWIEAKRLFPNKTYYEYI